MLRRIVVLLLLTTVALAPAASAWTLAPPPGAPAADALARAADAWTFGLARSIPTDVAGDAMATAACALGDVNADGVGDIVVQVRGAVGEPTTLVARAGPDFERILWQQASKATRLLECAPDLDADGVTDPVLRTIGTATSAGTEAAGVAKSSVQVVMQTLDGANGVAMIGRVATDTATGAANSAAGPAFGAAETATSTLLPAAMGAAAFLQTTVKEANVVSLPSGLPVAALTSTLQTTAHLDILDATGQVVAAIDIDQAGQAIMAIAPIPLLGSLPNVAVLTQQVVSPVQQVGAEVPKLAMYAADGTLSWTTELAASTGVALLVPRAGDLNLDGVQDLIVETVMQGVETAPGAAFQVLSGIDGSVILSSGAPVMGLMAALPLGSLPTGPALLQVERAAGAATMAISALDASGGVLWSATLEATAEPINAALDAYTGDIVGFTDLTGDGLPDVGSVVHQGASMSLQVIDGATGQVAWVQTLPDAANVLPIVLDVGMSAVAQAQANVASAIVAFGNATAPAVTLLDAATGQIQWVAQAVPQVSAAAALSIVVQAAGDLDADGVQDLLATVTEVAAGASASVEAPAAIVTALSGKTGLTLWATATSTVDAAVDLAFGITPGPAYRSVPAVAGAVEEQASPMPVAALVAVALLGLAVIRRKPIRRA